MVLITGASGFVGQHLINKLDGFVCIPHEDILNTDWSVATKVFFLSSYGNMAHHTSEEDIIRANVIDLCFVLATVDWSKIQSFVFFSTSSVKLKHQTMYSRTKKAAEEILLAYMEKYDVPITIIRPLSVTGVGEQKEHLIPKLIDSCMNGTEMDFVEEPVHDFIDVEDVIEGTLNLSNNKAKGIFELGRGKVVSNLDVLNLVESITKKKANVHKVKSMRDYDNDRWVSENFKARGYGWLSRKSLKLSIIEMVNDFKRRQTN